VNTASNIFKGVVHGNVIELDHAPGLPDGEHVNVIVQASGPSIRLPPGEGLRRAFGAWAEEAAELDKYLEWNRQQRKLARRELEP